MSSTGAEYVRNTPWLLRMDPFTKEGRVRAPNGVREYIERKIEISHAPTTIIVYQAPIEETISSS